MQKDGLIVLDLLATHLPNLTPAGPTKKGAGFFCKKHPLFYYLFPNSIFPLLRHPLTASQNFTSNWVALVKLGKQIGVRLNIRINSSSQFGQQKSEIKTIS